MGSISYLEKPHAVCIPFPAQGHINPMLNLAKLLHHKGFHITFVNTEADHERILKSSGPNALDGLPSFQFKTIPDGLSQSDPNATLCESTTTHCLAPFKDLLAELNNTSNVPPVSCIVSDGVMSFTLAAAEELGVPEVLFWTTSACGLLAYFQFKKLVQKGLTPLKEASYLTNGYLDQVIDWIPGMKNIRLKNLPSLIRTTNPEEYMIKFVIQETDRARKASAVILNTFEELEQDVVEELSTIVPSVYCVGPLQLLEHQVIEEPNESLSNLGSNFWKEDRACLDWLDSQEVNSVLYVNFGSITTLTPEQLMEFAWGLANSKQTFLWIIRPDLVSGDSAVISTEFLDETKERCLLAVWCPQEEVLNHPSVGGFLTHNGWNSTLESISSGVPMICWPFFAEQQTNTWFCCTQWGIGMEINSNVRRDEVEGLVRDLMVGKKGREMKKKAIEWKSKTMKAVEKNQGSSTKNLQKLIDEVLLSSGDTNKY